jgi:hypothetical protein
MDEEMVEVARSHLAVVPRTDEPELPILAPAAGAACHRAGASIKPIAQFRGRKSLSRGTRSSARAGRHTAGAGNIQRSAAIIPRSICSTARRRNLRSSSRLLPNLLYRRDGCCRASRCRDSSPPQIAATPPPPPVFELTLPPPAVKSRAATPLDPLAHIMALSDEERIALFT